MSFLRASLPLACLAISFLVPQIASGQYRATANQPHADFVLPRIDNREPVALSQFRGKKVLLIHFASW